MHAGIAATFFEADAAMVAIAVRDSVYFVDYSVHHLDSDHAAPSSNREAHVTNFVVSELAKYEHDHFCKFLSAGLSEELMTACPSLCSRLWAELDMVPIVSRVRHLSQPQRQTQTGRGNWGPKSIDEQADSMARKSIASVLRPNVSANDRHC